MHEIIKIYLENVAAKVLITDGAEVSNAKLYDEIY